jgi:hypothetical protein
MKKIALALLFVFATGSAVAQTYACQFIMAAGMLKSPQTGWKTTEFNVPEPFFLTMSNGLIDKNSLKGPPTGMHPLDTRCSKSEIDIPSIGLNHWCSSDSSYLSFSEKTLNGGFATTFGAMQSSSENQPDSVSVSRFKCQKVR